MHRVILICLVAAALPDLAVARLCRCRAASTLAGLAVAAREAPLDGSQVIHESLTDDDWRGLRAAYEAGARTVEVAPDALRARHDAQRWTSMFDGRGFTIVPDQGAWTWGLELERWGFECELAEIDGLTAGCAEAERVEYGWDASLTEWYVNGVDGLEHGYTVHRRPEGEGPLAFELAVRGSLETRIEADGRGARFEDASGATVLSYTGLVVFDATGRSLDARLVSRNGGLRIEVEEQGARYPLTIDPTVQQAYLKPWNTDARDRFGTAVAIAGDTVVVGAPYESSNSTAIDMGQGDDSIEEAGAAYVFVRNGTSWSQQAYLKAFNTGIRDRFGWSLAVSGDTVVVGAPQEGSNSSMIDAGELDNTAANAGAAYVFVRNGTTWSQQAYLKASNTNDMDLFGWSVSISDDTVVVGAIGEKSNSTAIDAGASDNSAPSAGATYVFARNGTSWSQQAYLKASNCGAGDWFGSAVAISGDTVVVGARLEDGNSTTIDLGQGDNSLPDAGAAYVFVRNGQAWSQQAYLKASNTGGNDLFGHSVAVDGATVVVGAFQEDSNSTSIGVGESDDSATNAGAAYVFTRNGTSWSRQAYLKASNADAADLFGHSVAVAGDTVAIGAQGEDSNSRVIDLGEGDNSLNAPGAAYVFARTGSTWAQRNYLKAFNSRTQHFFGSAIAIHDHTVLVGAPGERSNSNVIGSGELDDSLFNAGAAYVFSLPDFPASYCFGDGSGSACPCSPVPIPHGMAGRGCPTNLFPGGATASASGYSSFSADTLVLTAQDMPNGSMLFYQGTTHQSGGAGIAFGDGKRCIQPTAIRRFAPKPVVGNTASYPNPGDPPISVAGAIGAPGVRHYQGWYRSAHPTFCTPSTFNMTNALTITWEP